MRRPLLVLLLGLAPLAQAQTLPRDTALVRATALASAFFAGDDAAAGRHFDAAMHAAVPPAALGTIRQQLGAQVGPLEARGLPRAAFEGGYWQVRTRHTFARATLDVVVVVNEAGQVVGLFFRPAQPDLAVPYADTTAFRETPFRLLRPDAPALEGTLATPVAPEGRVPVVLLVHGSGALDRDETVGGVRVFRDLAHGLASRGIAVLRYDKRTRVYPEAFAGDYTVEEETVADALAALATLRLAGAPLDTARVVVVGHSLGALLAPHLAQRDGRLAGAALLAGPSRPLVQTLLDQFDYLGALDTTAATRAALAEARANVQRVLDPADTTHAALAGYPLRWWRALQGYNAVATAQAVLAPLLIVGAGRDFQVPPVEFAGWQAAFPDNPRATLVQFDDLNHALVAGEGPSTPAEYTRPAFVDVRVVDLLAAWVRALPPAR